MEPGNEAGLLLLFLFPHPHTEEAVEERAEYLLRSDLFRQIYFTSEGEPKKVRS